MNKKEFISRVTNTLRENDVRKYVCTPKHVFHISDDEGNTKDFIIKRTEKEVLFTVPDITIILDTCLAVIEDALQKGEEVSLHGFGSFALKHRAARRTKRPDTGEWIDIESRYTPKFSFGNDLRIAAKLYELSLKENALLPSEDTDRGDDL